MAVFYSTFLLLTLWCAYHRVFATEMDSCSSGVYPFNVTYSIGDVVCEATPCRTILGCPAHLSFNFVSPRYLEHFKPVIRATALGVVLNYPTNQEDACDGITNTQCPVVRDEPVSYRFTLFVPSFFPEVSVNLEFSLIDEDQDDEAVVCVQWDILVKRDSCP